MSETTAIDIADTWRARASELAEWTMHHMVNRTDAYGLYRADGSCTTAKDGLSLPKLVEHFQGERTLGLHAIGADDLCRFAAWDFDQHGENDPDSVAARNLEQALNLFGKLERLGMYPLLEDSDGKGGIHVWVLFDRPRHACDVYPWARALAPHGCEAFPKQAGVALRPGKGHYGNYIRIPGRHHKRPHWSRFYIGGEWYEGDDAIDLLIDWTPSDSSMVPAAPEEAPQDDAQQPQPVTNTPAVDALRHLMRLNPARADDYDDWVHVGMILHGIDPGPTMRAAWDAWSKQSSKYKPGECAEKWATFYGPAYAANNGGKCLGLGTLVMLANRDQGYEPPGQNADESNPIEEVGPYGITLRLIDVSRTSKKHTAKFDVLIDGTGTDMDLSVSDTSSGLCSAWSGLNEILGFVGKTLDDDAEKEVQAWLKTLISRKSLKRLHTHLEETRARITAHGERLDDRPTMQDVAQAYMQKHLGLKFIVPEPLAVWSERLGVFLRQSEFTSRVEPGLLEAVKGAHDYAAPTPNDPTKPIKHVQQVLKPVWCALTGSLPREVHASLGPDSKAAALFKQAITALWLTPETWMKFESTSEAPGHVERMSLASRVRELIRPAELRPERWQRVLNGVNAFFRVQPVPSQDPIAWLGMRVDLCHGEIKGQMIRGVENQHDLATLANRYGVADTTGVSIYITDDRKRRRLLVLSRVMCDYLINCEDEADDAPLRANADPGATQVVAGERIDTTTGEVLNET